MIVDVVDCQRCGKPNAVGLVFDAPPQLPAVEICADCLRTQVLRWLKDEHLPYGKGVKGSELAAGRRSKLGPFRAARYAVSEDGRVERPEVGIALCPRCGSADHYDPEGCPGPHSKPVASS